MKSELNEMMPSARPGQWKHRIRIGIAVAVFGLVLAESAGRLVSNQFRQRVMTYDDVVGWRPIADSRLQDDAGFGPYQVAINSRGLRDREHDFEKRDGQYRIVVLGDSIAFGYGGVEQHEVFADVLEDRLTDVEVINLAIPGFSTDQEYLNLKEHGLRYDPDLVLLTMYEDDFLPTFESFIPMIGRPKGHVRLCGNELDFHPPEFPAGPKQCAGRVR